jgi:hypothetical protein
MFGWLKRDRSPSRLAALLADYPSFAPPNLGRTTESTGSGPLLTLEQCRENLDAYRRAMPGRLGLLRGLLAQLGIDMDVAYSDTVTFVRLLHPTMLAELPSIYRPELRGDDALERSDRAGPANALTLMADLAMLDLDILTRVKPGCFVGLNLDPGDRDMFSYRRPCLLGLMDKLFPGPPDIFYLEEEWTNFYLNMDDPRRLALPDRVIPEAYGAVIGGPMLIRLDRYIADPKLDERMRTTWLGKAA